MEILLKKKLLLAENDPDYLHSLKSLLELEDYDVEEASTVKEAIEKLMAGDIDLALIDLRLTNEGDPADFSGLEIAKKAQDLHIRCIIISAYPSVEIIRQALRTRGAPPLAVDFVPKLGGPHAILDSVRVILSNFADPPPTSNHRLRVDLDQSLVWRGDVPIELTQFQYDLIAHLCRQAGAVCPPEELIKTIYNQQVTREAANNDRRLERLVERVREKIEDDPNNPKHLLTVYGRGYRMVIDA